MGQTATVVLGGDSFVVYSLTSDANADALSFWNVRIGAAATAWAAASTDDQNRCLVSASDWIDRAMEFSGTKTVAAQPRDWPRDGTDCDGTSVTSGTTPDNLALATFWLAGQVIVDNDAASSPGTGSNVKSARAGTAKVEFFSATDGTRLPLTAVDYIGCYAGGGNISGGTATGTDSSSAFDDCDFDRSAPLS